MRGRQRDILHTVPEPSLRTQHVQETRAALIAGGRQLFGTRGFAATSVDDLTAAAGVTTGALYHHFTTKTDLFAAVFQQVHEELLVRAAQASERAKRGQVERLLRAFESFLDAVLEPEVARIIVLDAPAVLGLERFTELDERYAFIAIVDTLKAARDDGELRFGDAETLARLLLGALTRGGMLIANAADQRRTRNAVARTLRELLSGLSR
jgi:AcrR family transcriptional regulator